MLQLLRPRPVSQLTSILGVPEDLFEGDDEEAAAALGGDEQNNAVTASETLMPLLQASTRAAALLAQEQGQLGSLRFVRRLRMEYGSDGTPIQYDGEDKRVGWRAHRGHRHGGGGPPMRRSSCQRRTVVGRRRAAGARRLSDPSASCSTRPPAPFSTPALWTRNFGRSTQKRHVQRRLSRCKPTQTFGWRAAEVEGILLGP